jgi:hypothetical protein
MVSRAGSLRQSNTEGLSLAEILTLPPQQRKIVQWLMKHSQKGVTLREVAVQIDASEQVTLALLDELVEEGFVQEFPSADDICYRILLAAKRGFLQENLQQALAPGNPLAVILNPSGDSVISVGSSLEIYVTVTNKGAESALIDVFIEELSPSLLQWCDAPRQRLALGANSSSEVFFTFTVPPSVSPGIYQYQIIVDAPQHYPEDTPIRYPRKIQVLPGLERVVRVSDPTLTLSPPTSSRSPAQISANGFLQVNVKVHNRSDRVDRFRLTIPDIDSSWYTVLYPEGLETVGLVTPNMGLDLNPGEQGDIIVMFQPPASAVAGLYYPTVRLYSTNNSDLVLLDVVYLEVLPFHLMHVELLTVVGKVKRKSGRYELRVTNAGNTARSITCNTVAVDEDDSCTYKVTPGLLQVLPGEKASLQVTVEPVKWWRRPLFAASRLINFRVELEDQQELPISNATPQGTLIWEPRPLWQLLLLLLTVLGTLGALIFVLWWLFFRPPAVPKILQFAASDNLYQAANGDFVRLNWRIRNPKQLQSLEVTGLLADGTAAVQPLSYKFNGSLPEELKPFCQMAAVLTCTNIPTDARKTGDYVFEIKAFSKNNQEVAADTIKTNNVKILPEPEAKIVEFSSAKPVYQEVATPIENSNVRTENKFLLSADRIRLNWRINNLEKVKELQVIGRSPEGLVNSPLQRYDLSKGLPNELKAFCDSFDNQLICRNVPGNNRGAGNYIFEILLFSKASPEKPSDGKKTDTIQVKALPSKILEFQINGINASTKYLIPINPAKPKAPIKLSWKVGSSKNVKVELLPAPGNVPTTGTILYPISQEPSSETITLQAVGADGEKISRSVTIQTFIPAPPPQPKAPAKTKTSSPQQKQNPTPTTGKPSSQPTLNPTPSPSKVPPTAPIIPPPPPIPGGSTNNPSNGTTTPSAQPTPTSPPTTTPNSPTLSDPGKLSPSELPPQF